MLSSGISISATTCSTIACNSNSGVAKWLVTVAVATSATPATSVMVMPLAPRRAKTSTAASTMRARVCATCSARRCIEYARGVIDTLIR